MLTRRTFISTLTALPALAPLLDAMPQESRNAVLRQMLALKPEIQHWSDCATNNEPAYPLGPCNCFHVGARIEDRFNKMKATVTEITEHGFKYEYDAPFNLGHRSGTLGGQCFFEGFKNWRRI